MSNSKALCVYAAASAGGHLSQLLKLADSWARYDIVYVTTTEVVQDKLSRFGRIYVVGECNRQHPFRFIRVFCRCVKVIARKHPDVVISTGAAVGCIMCCLGKIVGAKVVWIDSITNVDKLSLSGRIVRYIADLFIVQWPELAERYKNVEFVGEII